MSDGGKTGKFLRARVALALSCAEHALQGVSIPSDLGERAESSLALGWRWVDGENICALELYQPLDALAYDSMDFDGSSREWNALLSVVDALYCVTREALSVEARGLSDQQYQQQYNWVLTDLTDWTEEEALEWCLQKAQAASEDAGAEASRQQGIWERLVKDYGADDPQALGPPLTRAYFGPNGFLS